MDATPDFTIPEGATLTLENGLAHLKYPGSLHLHGSLGEAVGSIEVEGDLFVHVTDLSGTSLFASGHVEVLHALEANHVHGKTVRLSEGPVRCNSISADATMAIAALEIRVDALIAPHIDIDQGTSGRATVLECLNEVGSSKVKGCFSLEDYEDAFGQTDAFLSERGLSRPEPLAEEVSLPPHPSSQPVVAAPPPPIETIDVGNIRIAPARDPRIDRAFKKIVDAYGDEFPDVLTEMRSLIEAGAYHGLKDKINPIWESLLSYHQTAGIRPHHRVTHAFNLIHGLVQE